MFKRFTTYTHNAIANFKNRCARMEQGRAKAEEAGDVVLAWVYKKQLQEQKFFLSCLFLFFFFCLYIVAFGWTF